MNAAQTALKAFLDSADVTTLYYPQFNPWGGNRAYFKKFEIDVLWDLVADPTRYPFDLGYHWGVFKVIRGPQLGQYLNLLQAASVEE